MRNICWRSVLAFEIPKTNTRAKLCLYNPDWLYCSESPGASWAGWVFAALPMRPGLPATTFPPTGGSLILCAPEQGFAHGNQGFNPQVKLFLCIWCSDTSLQQCVGVLSQTTGSGLSAAKRGEMPVLVGDSFRAADGGLGTATKGSSDITGPAAPSVWPLVSCQNSHVQQNLDWAVLYS